MTGEQNSVRLDEDMLSYAILCNRIFNDIFECVLDETPRTHLVVIFLLQRYGPMPISRIGKQLIIAKPNMTLLIRELISKGWVRKSRNRLDHRVMDIVLTEQGESVLQGAMEKVDILVRKKFSVLSPREAEDFRQAIRTQLALGEKVLE